MSTPPIATPAGTYRLGGLIPVKCPHCGHDLAQPPDPGTPSFELELGRPKIIDPGLLLPEPAPAIVRPPAPVITSAAEALLAPAGPAANKLFDHPEISGKLTVCVLCYGDFLQLHQRCINGIRHWAPPGRLDLRIAANQVQGKSRRYLETVSATKIYWNDAGRLKYEAMREMLWDPSCPLETRWLIWFDDDSEPKHPRWLELACESVIQTAGSRIGMLGRKYSYRLSRTQEWFRGGSWHQRRPMSDRHGREAPNGDSIQFIGGGFWIASVEALQDCQIPDPRLVHWGGDIVIGEQLWQHRWGLKEFNRTQELVQVSAHKPRGASLPANSLAKRKKLPWSA